MRHEFPQHRTSEGRRITVDRSEDEEDVLLFIYEDRSLSSIRRKRGLGDGPIGWSSGG
jgi:hypothetical protein